MTKTGLKLKTASLRGLKTAWFDNENAGKPIVFLLHGYPDTPDAWSDQVEAFSHDFHLILPYGRGVGPSSAPERQRRYGAYSILLDHLEIMRLTDASERTPLHVVGHDIGGMHAWLLASHPHPRLRTVSILNSAHPKQYLRRVFWPRQVVKSWYVGAFQLPFVPEAAIWFFHKQLLAAVAKEGWKPPHHEQSLKDFEGSAVNAMNEYRQFARDIPHFLRDHAGPVEAPVLVISSEDDSYLEAPSTTEFSDLARSVTVRVIKGKHWLHREQPERINRLLGDFWKAHP
ncbi:MAG: alpha/beta fold hydrolase [Elusimicrobia bacterium]|nr:alpha/beta fold hydrolase [Elusimicrobiota bacterium]